MFVASEFPGFVGRFDRERPNDVLFAISPLHYLNFQPDPNNPGKEQAVPTLSFSSSVSSIGVNALQGYEVVFDLDEDRIGFAIRKGCPKRSSLLTNSGPTEDVPT